MHIGALTGISAFFYWFVCFIALISAGSLALPDPHIQVLSRRIFIEAYHFASPFTQSPSVRISGVDGVARGVESCYFHSRHRLPKTEQRLRFTVVTGASGYSYVDHPSSITRTALIKLSEKYPAFCQLSNPAPVPGKSVIKVVISESLSSRPHNLAVTGVSSMISSLTAHAM
jgi:hypothetical protein